MKHKVLFFVAMTMAVLISYRMLLNKETALTVKQPLPPISSKTEKRPDLPEGTSNKLLSEQHIAPTHKLSIEERKKKVMETLSRITKSHDHERYIEYHVNQRHQAFDDLYKEWSLDPHTIREIGEIIREQCTAKINSHIEYAPTSYERTGISQVIRDLTQLQFDLLLGGERAKTLMERDEQERMKAIQRAPSFVAD
jgi:hypothetical protein